MYKVKRQTYNRHTDASAAAKFASRIFPVRLRAEHGHAWYWHGEWKGRRFADLLR